MQSILAVLVALWCVLVLGCRPAGEASNAAPEPAPGPPPALTLPPAAEPAPPRVAVLNFGPPAVWNGRIDGTVGIQINAKAWEDVIPLLEADRVDVVVVRVNSGGGMLAEVQKFQDLFENQYKKRWRTVVWVESAISAACMCPWVLPEWYFMPEGAAGAVGDLGWLPADPAGELQRTLDMMARASAKAGRSPLIARSMMVTEPLSCDIDEQDHVTWRQDEAGRYQVNPAGQILTFNARDALKFGFASGTASSREELAAAMGIGRMEWAGSRAAKFIDDDMRKNDQADKAWQEAYTRYLIALRGAKALPGEKNRERRMVELRVADQQLSKLEPLLKVNPVFGAMVRPVADAAWFESQRELLRKLAE